MYHRSTISCQKFFLDQMLSPRASDVALHHRGDVCRLLDELGDKAPALLRGGGYGNEETMDVCEQRDLLRLRKTANV